MEIEVRIPPAGESVQEGLLAQWHAQDGDRVRKDDALLTVETDKITFEVAAEADGVLRVLVPEGESVKIGAVVAKIVSEGREAAEAKDQPDEPEPEKSESEEVPLEEEEDKEEEGAAEPEDGEPPPEKPSEEREPQEAAQPGEGEALAPSVRRLAEEKGVDVSRVKGTGPGGRLTKGDLLLYLEQAPEKPKGGEPKAKEPEKKEPEEKEPKRDEKEAKEAPEATTRKPMTPIRRRIAEHLLEARRNTAMLTTFNEVDMSRVQAFRKEFRDAFREKHGVSLGIMSFFVKASIEALREFPEVNAFIEGTDILYHDYYHVGVAVGAERGLVVPVLRHADRMSFAQIEQAIRDYVARVETNRLAVADLEGGTFTVTNGGVFGSLLSTPILNAPQSGILALHKIEDRPVVVSGQVAIRPMMYVALSYDHRIVDGRQAVTFLRRIKECVEDPERLLVEI